MLGLAKRVGARLSLFLNTKVDDLHHCHPCILQVVILIDRILLTSTSEVYGDPLVHPQPESYWGNVNPIGTYTSHSQSKLVYQWHHNGDNANLAELIIMLTSMFYFHTAKWFVILNMHLLKSMI